MNSYQRRKRDIEFLRQRGEDLEAYVRELAQQTVDLGAEPRLPMLGGVCGDRYLNDINTGDFCLRLMGSLKRETGDLGAR